VNGNELRRIRKKLGLTQVQFGERVGLTGNSIARAERDEVEITPTLALLVGYVEASFDPADRQGGRGAAQDKAAKRAEPRHPVRKSRSGKGR